MKIGPHKWTYETKNVHVNKSLHAWYNVANKTNEMWVLEGGKNKQEQQYKTSDIVKCT